MTILNAYSKDIINISIAGLDYNAYALILADVADGNGVLIFESCFFSNWSIQMHYGINIAVQLSSLVINNTVFQQINMLPLWHILNIKETSQMTMVNTTFNSWRFQQPQSSNGFAINIIDFHIDPAYPSSIVNNVTVFNMSTNFFQLINVDSNVNNSSATFTMSNMNVSNNFFDAEISLFQFNGFLLSNANLTFQITNSTFTNNNFSLYGDIINLQQNMYLPVSVSNSYFANNFGAMFTLISGNIALTNTPTQLVVNNCTFLQNVPYSKALIVVNENCMSFVYNCVFLENYSVSRGSVIMADYQDTQNYFANCTFVNNSASVGGVFYTQFGSMIDCYNCTVQNNFGIKGGVVYTSNDGYIQFRYSQIIWNKSLYSSILVTLSSPTSYTMFNNTYIYQNTLLQLSDFINMSNPNNYTSLPPPASLSYLTPAFSLYILQNIVSIQNSVQLGLIYALNSISSNLMFNNVIIDTQMNIMSSFEASIVGSNMTIQNTIVSSTQNLLELTSTNFIITGFNMYNVSCDPSTAAKDNYLMSALLNSVFNITNLNVVNSSNPLAFLLSSSLFVFGGQIYNVSTFSTLYEPFSITDSSLGFYNYSIKNITVPQACDSIIRSSFSNVYSSNLSMSNINQTYILASDSFMYLNYSYFFRDYSLDPPNLLEQDFTIFSYVRSFLLASTTPIQMIGCTVQNFFSTDSGGAISVTNSYGNLFDSNILINNYASIGGGLYLYCDSDQNCSYTILNSTFINNTGVQQGGAIYYNYFAPNITLSNQTFIGNSAPYGANISAYAFKLAITNLGAVLNQVSGQMIENPINIEVRDYYDNIIANDNSTYKYFFQYLVVKLNFRA